MEDGNATISENEWRKNKYSRTEREADTLGRVIGVRRLRLSEQMKVTGFTPDLNGYDVAPDKQTGELRYIPHRLTMLAASAVCEINSDHIPFPQSRGELEAILNRLDTPGISAAITAFARFPDVDPVQKEEAKNSPGTPYTE